MWQGNQTGQKPYNCCDSTQPMKDHGNDIMRPHKSRHKSHAVWSGWTCWSWFRYPSTTPIDQHSPAHILPIPHFRQFTLTPTPHLILTPTPHLILTPTPHPHSHTSLHPHSHTSPSHQDSHLLHWLLLLHSNVWDTGVYHECKQIQQQVGRPEAKWGEGTVAMATVPQVITKTLEGSSYIA